MHVSYSLNKKVNSLFPSLAERYQASDTTHRVQVRAKQEKELLSLGDINSILESQHMKEICNAALNYESGPLTMKDFIDLRDVLIVRLTIGSLRRSMVFAEFTMDEYQSREKRTMPDGTNSVVMRITRHKTATKGN